MSNEIPTLRDPQDRRLPRISPPCGLVIFGITGDLARKKLLPAIYDLANRGLLHPAFSLTGFARRDWSPQDFEEYVRASIELTPAPVLTRGRGTSCAQACASCPVHSTTPRPTAAWQTQLPNSTACAAPAATTPSTCRSRRPTSPSLPSICPTQASTSARAVSGDASSSRSHSGTISSRRANSPTSSHRSSTSKTSSARPLPGQGNRPEHHGDALRERHVRAAVEGQLRRFRADYDG